MLIIPLVTNISSQTFWFYSVFNDTTSSHSCKAVVYLEFNCWNLAMIMPWFINPCSCKQLYVTEHSNSIGHIQPTFMLVMIPCRAPWFALLAKHYYDDDISNDEKNEVLSMHREGRNPHGVFVGVSKEKRPFWWLSINGRTSLKKDIKEMRCDDVKRFIWAMTGIYGGFP
jgi:hypothetical protein